MKYMFFLIFVLQLFFYCINTSICQVNLFFQLWRVQRDQMTCITALTLC